jgi:hypothetical protein
MKNSILTNLEEPTDIQLVELMREVAKEAEEKALAEQQRLKEKIANELIILRFKLK